MAATSFTLGTTDMQSICAGAFSKKFLLGSDMLTVITHIRSCLTVRGGGNSPITSRLGLATATLTVFLTYLQTCGSSSSFRLIFLISQLRDLPQHSSSTTILIEHLQIMISAECSTWIQRPTCPLTCLRKRSEEHTSELQSQSN